LRPPRHEENQCGAAAIGNFRSNENISLYYYSPEIAERSFGNIRKTRKHLKFEILSDGGLTEQLCPLATGCGRGVLQRTRY
jgi:hypothetical protein